ncbi:Hypothetical predicted protein [Cloeon dipterum]|uniref:Transmembrane protein n=1 Tax=Cloeon dipterum TaxID=197152 RepID=A0A8S1D1L5_9INSE|nr:Hypothetical predicted protein [Cloeon dipterum]
MGSGGKLLLVLLSTCLHIFTCSCVSIIFQNNTINNWELLLGATEKEFKYDFCRKDASNNKERCHNLPFETIDIRGTCNCTLKNTANAEGDVAYFALKCNNGTLDDLMGACPQKLTVIYEHGNLFRSGASAETPTADQMEEKSSRSSPYWNLLFFLSLVINVVLGVALFVLKKQLLQN